MMAELIKMMDTSLLSLEISGLVHKYADVRFDHLVNLLVMRVDITVGNANQVSSSSSSSYSSAAFMIEDGRTVRNTGAFVRVLASSVGVQTYAPHY